MAVGWHEAFGLIESTLINPPVGYLKLFERTVPLKPIRQSKGVTQFAAVEHIQTPVQENLPAVVGDDVAIGNGASEFPAKADPGRSGVYLNLFEIFQLLARVVLVGRRDQVHGHLFCV